MLRFRHIGGGDEIGTPEPVGKGEGDLTAGQPAECRGARATRVQ